MAVDESQFKAQFRKSLKLHYEDAVIWTNNDMFRVGLPDFSVSWRSKFYAIEAKFVSELPKRKTSLALKHEVSPVQVDFLKKIKSSGNWSGVLVGMKDVAAVMTEIKTNYTLEELLAGNRINKNGAVWAVHEFFSHLEKVT